MSNIAWAGEAEIHGVQVKAWFFDGDVVKAKSDLIERALPMLADAPVKPTLVATEADRKNFYFENLVAQPDVVFEHGKGLICVEYKSVGAKNHSRQAWAKEIRLVDMLQNIIASFVVAQSSSKITACVLRYHNVVYLLTPPEKMLMELRRLAPLGMQYVGDNRRIAARQLADFASTRIEAMFPAPESASATAGRVAHDTMLRRNT